MRFYIYQAGDTVAAVSKKVHAISFATCGSKDEFDLKLGAAIAVLRWWPFATDFHESDLSGYHYVGIVQVTVNELSRFVTDYIAQVRVARYSQALLAEQFGLNLKKVLVWVEE